MYLKINSSPGISNNISTVKWKQLLPSKIHKKFKAALREQTKRPAIVGRRMKPDSLKRLEIEPSCLQVSTVILMD